MSDYRTATEKFFDMKDGRIAALISRLAAAEAERDRYKAVLEQFSSFGNFTDVQHCRIRDIAREALAKGTVK